jgi:hypothetical protein
MNVWMKVGLRDFTLVNKSDYLDLEGKTIVINNLRDNYRRCYIWINKKQTLLHRYIMKPNDNEQVDHIDNDPMNNTRENLRPCNHQQNSNNKWILNTKRRSIFKGLIIEKNGDIHWAYQDNIKGICFTSQIYFSQKFAYIDYCTFKIKQMGEFFQYKKIETFSLEKILPRKARVLKTNKSGYRGVCSCARKSTPPWRVNIRINGKQTHCGYFYDKIEAAKHYDKLAFKKSGYLAFLNFPDKYTIFL